jgi:hypothetical protein
MRIDEDLFINAVRSLKAEGGPARADTVSVELGAIADDGEHWDGMTVADDLGELESLGKTERDGAFEWEGNGLPPKTRIAYVRVRTKTPYPCPPRVLNRLAYTLPRWDRVSVGLPGFVRAGRTLPPCLERRSFSGAC